MPVKCGNRKVHGDTNTYHVSAADVKACFTGQLITETNDLIDAIEARQPAEARKLTDNERSTLQRMRVSGGYTAEQSAYWKGLWAEDAPDADEATGPVDEGNWAEQETDRYAARKVEYTTSTRRSPKGRDIPTEFGGSPKQYDLLFDLSEQRNLGLNLAGGAYFSVGAASQMITKIFEGKVVSRPAYEEDQSGQFIKASPVRYATEDGIYRNPATGEIFKVQYNRATGDGRHLYTKQLVVEGDITNVPLTGERAAGRAAYLDWRYVGSIAKAGVLAEWRMTREDAAKFGALYGVCVRCHRDLTAEDSIERAMGPICAGKMGW